METDPVNVQAVKASSAKEPDDAGNSYKMASSSASAINTLSNAEHELTILDVEGAPAASKPPIIELDDDNDGDDGDFDNVPLVAELQTALIGNKDDKSVADPLQEETLSTKEEPSSDVESTGSYHGPDPMGLLQRMESNRRAQDMHEDDEDDNDDSEDVDEECSGTHRINRAERWQVWMKRFQWLLHDESDGEYAYCHYCNVVINVNRKLKYIHQHNLSLFHQERENNYLAFKNSEQQMSIAEDEVKHEFGSSSYVIAMKKKRASEVKTFNEFNWSRWLKWHSWLERVQSEGTIGQCRYCNVRMNVEFVYLRKRHETSKGHCEAQRSHEKASRKRKRSTSNTDVSVENVSDAKSSAKQLADVPNVMTVVGAGLETADPSDWCKLLPDTNPQQCRCTLCDCRMAITSFMRHLKTKVHCNNLSLQKQNLISKMPRGVWAQYEELHPWLVADPNDPTLAYCHVCSRRFMYGHSEIKRKNHEKSEKHQAAMAAAAKQTDDNDNETDNDEEQQQSEQTSEQQSESNLSDDDYIAQDDNLSVSQKSSVGDRTDAVNAANKTVSQVSWIYFSKDHKIQLCKYCRVRFHSEGSKKRHLLSDRHKKLAKQFKSRQAARYKNARQRRKQQRRAEEQANSDDNENGDQEVDEDNDDDDDGEEDEGQQQSNVEDAELNSNEEQDQVKASKATPKPALKPVPLTMQGKVMVWKNRFPWLSYKRSETRSNYGWCKLCEVSVFLPSAKFASRHQRSARHIRLRLDRKRAGLEPPALGDAPALNSTSAAPSAPLPTGEAKNKAAMAELQAKYAWLEPDASDENHCHCKICDTRLPIKVFYLRQHDGSRKHVERCRSTAETAVEAQAAPAASLMDVDQESDEGLSVKSEGSITEQPPSKRSRRSLEVRRILRALRDSVGKRQEERSQLEMAKDMISSSFDIVSKLRTLERESDSRDLTMTQAAVVASPTQPRDTLDLFFDSVTQTMKSLPVDLVAEGKAKIMQIVCDLELRSMQRNASIQPDMLPESADQSKAPASSLSTEAKTTCLTFEEVLDACPGSPESVSSSITIDDPNEDLSVQFRANNSNTSAAAEPRLPLTNNPSSTAAAAATSLLNGRNKEVPLNIRRILPSSVQIAAKADAAEPLRVVPINKLTTANPNQNKIQNHNHSQNVRNVNGVNVSTPVMMQRSGQQQQQHVSPNDVVMATPSNSNSSAQSELCNGTSSGSGDGNSPMYRKIRVSNGNSSKLITFRKTQQYGQQQPQQQQQLQGQHITSVRFSNSNDSNLTTLRAQLTQAQLQAQAQAQIQAQAQAQLRSLANNRTVVRQMPANRTTLQ